MKKTLLLCFIHGFKGGEATFGEEAQFTEDLRQMIADALPKVVVKALVYPKYETRGDLGDCVSRFRDWLQEKVIDIEVEAKTPSPTIDPSVRTILIGHSMGGIVAAETAIGLASEKPIYTEDGIQKPDAESSKPMQFNSLMFPYIQGVLAFDTPYLGISPGVVAHTAEGHYQSAQSAAAAITQLTGLGTSLWGAGKAANAPVKPSAGALPGPPAAAKEKSQQPQQQQQQQQKGSQWGTWGKVAMFAGAAGAVAAGGAAAWMNRDQITEGWSWVSSHLVFVGCLARGEELKKRVTCMVQLQQQTGVGFANLYTRLGKAAPSKEVSMVGTVLGKERTFCNLPNKMDAGTWREAVNDKATDETLAHMGMFEKKENPAYDKLARDARDMIAGWLQNDWYETSMDDHKLIEE